MKVKIVLLRIAPIPGRAVLTYLSKVSFFPYFRPYLIGLKIVSLYFMGLVITDLNHLDNHFHL